MAENRAFIRILYSRVADRIGIENDQAAENHGAIFTSIPSTGVMSVLAAYCFPGS